MGIWNFLTKNDTKGLQEVVARAELQIPYILPSFTVTTEEALTHPIILRCVNLISTAVAQLDMKTYKYNEEISNPLVVRLPDRNRSRYAFLKRTAFDLALYGEFFWLLDRGSNGQVKSAEVLEPNRVSVHFNDSGVKHFTVGDKTYSDTQVIHGRLNELPGNARGKGPVQLNGEFFRNAIDLSHYSGDIIKDGIPVGYIAVPGELNQEEKELARKNFNDVIRTGGTPVFDHGASYESTGLSPQDLGLIEQLNYIDRSVCNTFGVPSGLMEIPSNGSSITYSTRRDLEDTLYRQGIAGYLAEIESAFNALLPAGQYVRFDIDSRLRPNTSERYEALSTGIAAGVLTVDEARATEGLPPINAPQEETTE